MNRDTHVAAQIPDPDGFRQTPLGAMSESAAYTLRESQALHEVGVAHHGWYMTEAEHRGVLGVLNELGAILDDLCDWAQHVAAPENDGIHSIVERAEAMLKGERDA